MVEAIFTKDKHNRILSLKVSGHAGQNEPGNDIVCAAVSALTYTVAQNILNADSRGILKEKPTVMLYKGQAEIICRADTKESFCELYHTYKVIQTGFQVLAHNYPQYVAIRTFGET